MATADDNGPLWVVPEGTRTGRKETNEWSVYSSRAGMLQPVSV